VLMDAPAEPTEYTGQPSIPCGYGTDCHNKGTRSVNGGWMCDECYERYLRIYQDMRSALAQKRKNEVKQEVAHGT
jgi:hypothetical protein